MLQDIDCDVPGFSVAVAMFKIGVGELPEAFASTRSVRAQAYVPDVEVLESVESVERDMGGVRCIALINLSNDGIDFCTSSDGNNSLYESCIPSSCM